MHFIPVTLNKLAKLPRFFLPEKSTGTHALSTLAVLNALAYCSLMVIIRFQNADAEKRALGWLAGRFSFKTWNNGDLMLHESTLPYLAREGVSFTVKGPASYEHFAPAIRNPHPAAV
jgi:hypothetical protein